MVHPGDRLRFRVTARRGGHVLVAGIDSRGEAYVCAPSDGRSQALTAGETTTLADAVELDDVLGSERIVAIVCPEPFRFDEIATRLHADDLGDAGDGCQRDSLVLLKR